MPVALPYLKLFRSFRIKNEAYFFKRMSHFSRPAYGCNRESNVYSKIGSFLTIVISNSTYRQFKDDLHDMLLSYCNLIASCESVKRFQYYKCYSISNHPYTLGEGESCSLKIRYIIVFFIKYKLLYALLVKKLINDRIVSKIHEYIDHISIYVSSAFLLRQK